MLIGQVFLHFLASGLVVSFFKSLRVKSFLGVLIYGFFGFGITLAEICVVVIQSVIFVKLIFIYSGEGTFNRERLKGKKIS